MLTYDRAYDHDKHMSWGIFYLLDMYNVLEKHPLLCQYFMERFLLYLETKHHLLLIVFQQTWLLNKVFC